MKEKFDAQTHKDPGASFVIYGGGPALSAWVAQEGNRVSEQELTGVAERVHADLARKVEERELEARGQFKVSSPEELGAQSKDLVSTRWVLTWMEVDGVDTAQAQ